MEDGGGKRAVNVGIPEGFEKVFHGARAAGGNQRDVANVTYFFNCSGVITVTYAVLIHHVQDDFRFAPRFGLPAPSPVFPLRDAGTAFIPGILINVIFAGFDVIPRINAHHDALHAKAIRQTGDKFRFGQRRGVDGDFVRPE